MSDLIPVEQSTPVLRHGSDTALRMLRAAIGQADEARRQLAEAGDWEALAWALSAVRALSRDLRTLERATVEDVAGLLPEKRVTIDGLGTVERRKASTRRAWQSEDLFRRLLAQALVDPETGEILAGSTLEVAETIGSEVLACMPVTASMGWRVTALRARGLDPEDWCETTEGPASITIHGDTEADR